MTVAGGRTVISPKGRDSATPVVEEVASRATPKTIGDYASRVEFNDTSHGVRRPFGEMSSGDRCVSLPS